MDPITSDRITSGLNTNNVAGVNNSGSELSNVTGEVSKSLIGGNIDLEKTFENIFNQGVEYFNYLFEPIQLNFSTEIMSNQIQNLSILL